MACPLLQRLLAALAARAAGGSDARALLMVAHGETLVLRPHRPAHPPRPAPPFPSLPYKVDTSRPSLRTNWTRLAGPAARGAGAFPRRPPAHSSAPARGARGARLPSVGRPPDGRECPARPPSLPRSPLLPRRPAAPPSECRPAKAAAAAGTMNGSSGRDDERLKHPPAGRRRALGARAAQRAPRRAPCVRHGARQRCNGSNGSNGTNLPLPAREAPHCASPRGRAPAPASPRPRARARAPRPGVTRSRPVSRPNAQASCDFDRRCGAPPPPSCAVPPPPPAAGTQARRWPTSLEAVLLGTDPDADARWGSERSALVSAEALAAALLAAAAASGAVGCLALRLTRTLL